MARRARRYGIGTYLIRRRALKLGLTAEALEAEGYELVEIFQPDERLGRYVVYRKPETAVGD